jgi:hypothetical protein
MTTEELIQLVGEEQPELLAKIAETIQALENESPDAVPEVLEDFNKIAQVITEKTAGINWARGRRWVKLKNRASEGAATAVGATAVAAAAGLAAAGGSDLYHAAKNKVTERHHFKKMLKAFPQLAENRWDDNSEMTEEHKRRMPMAFKTLHKLAPDMASDPISAAALTRQLVLAPDSYEGLKKTLDSQKAYQEGREKSRLRPFK